MKPAEKTPGIEPWRTSSLADGTALGIVPGYTERPTLEICDAVLGRSMSRRLASPDPTNYFGDPLRPSGMVRAVQDAVEDRKDVLSEIGGHVSVSLGGRVKQG